ncbi:hypothetical protein BGZ83_002302, partial [Gryganskiella cystojenkinii]
RPDETLAIYHENGRAIYKTMRGICAFLYLPEGDSGDLSKEMQMSPPVPLKTTYLLLAIAMHQDRGTMDLTIRTLSYLFPIPGMDLDRWADVQLKYLKIESVLKANTSIGSCPELFLVEELVDRSFVDLWTFWHTRIHGRAHKRLKHLGDCVGEMVMSMILHRRFPESIPKRVITLTMVSLSNDTLGAWAISVGLHKGINYQVKRGDVQANRKRVLKSFAFGLATVSF